MNLYLWILVGLVAAGLILALIPLPGFIGALMRVKRHTEALRQSQLLLSAQSLAIQSQRFSKYPADAQALVKRASAAIESARISADELRLERARESLADTGEELRALGRDLR